MQKASQNYGYLRGRKRVSDPREHWQRILQAVRGPSCVSGAEGQHRKPWRGSAPQGSVAVVRAEGSMSRGPTDGFASRLADGV